MRDTIVPRWRRGRALAAAVVLAAAARLAELALGKAAAFGYAVMVSLAANFAIDIARAPTDNLLHAALLLLAGKTPEAQAVLPRLDAAPSSAAAAARPGPGSGGLY